MRNINLLFYLIISHFDALYENFGKSFLIISPHACPLQDLATLFQTNKLASFNFSNQKLMSRLFIYSYVIETSGTQPQNKLSLFQKLSFENSSSARVGTSCQPSFPSYEFILLEIKCLVHTVLTCLSSYIQLPNCFQKTLFLSSATSGSYNVYHAYAVIPDPWNDGVRY